MRGLFLLLADAGIAFSGWDSWFWLGEGDAFPGPKTRTSTPRTWGANFLLEMLIACRGWG
jgi:hypothetical protein